jgi:hypothetical protein
MRNTTFVTMDEYLVKQATADYSSSVFTGAQFNTQLGRLNQYAVHAVLDNITTDATPRKLLGFIDHSNDGRLWVQRSNPNGTAYQSSDADLVINIPASASITGPVHSACSDACLGASFNGSSNNRSGPLLGFVRLRFFFDNTVAGGHLRVTVTQRSH